MVAAPVKPLLFHLLLLFCIFTISRSADPDCVYTIYIQTGSILSAGTDSTIGLTLSDAKGYGLRIKDIVAWGGLMGPGYNYFERGNIDIFSGPGACLTGPVCSLNLTSDGSGGNASWYCNYVAVIATGVNNTSCSHQQFEVDQWLATDVYPYELTTIRNYCDDLRRSDPSYVVPVM